MNLRDLTHGELLHAAERAGFRFRVRSVPSLHYPDETTEGVEYTPPRPRRKTRPTLLPLFDEIIRRVKHHGFSEYLILRHLATNPVSTARYDGR